MLTVLLVVQIMISVAMVAVILLQRSASDGLAGLGGGGGGDSILSSRSSANLLTRTTAILAAAFIINSLAMATITSRLALHRVSITDQVEGEATTPAAAPEEQKPSVPLQDSKDAEPAANSAMEKLPAATTPAEKAPAPVKAMHKAPKATHTTSKPSVPEAQ